MTIVKKMKTTQQVLCRPCRFWGLFLVASLFLSQCKKEDTPDTYQIFDFSNRIKLGFPLKNLYCLDSAELEMAQRTLLKPLSPCLKQYICNEIAHYYVFHNAPDKARAVLNTPIDMPLVSDTATYLKSEHDRLYGEVLTQEWKCAEAMAYYKKAINLRQSICEKDSLPMAILYLNLGRLLTIGFSDYTEGGYWLLRAKGIMFLDKRTPVVDKIYLCLSLSNLYRWKTQILRSSAYAFYADMLKSKLKTTLKEKTIISSLVDFNLGNFYASYDRPMEADSAYEQTLSQLKYYPYMYKIKAKTYIYKALSSFYVDANKSAAEVFIKQALSTCAPNVLICQAEAHWHYGEILGSSKQKSSFQELYKAKDIYQSVMGKNSPYVGRVWYTLGLVFEAKGDLEQAFNCFQETIGCQLSSYNTRLKINIINTNQVTNFEYLDLYVCKKSNILYKKGKEQGRIDYLKAAIKHYELVDTLRMLKLGKGDYYTDIHYADIYQVATGNQLDAYRNLAILDPKHKNLYWEQAYQALRKSKSRMINKSLITDNIDTSNDKLRHLLTMQRQNQGKIDQLQREVFDKINFHFTQKDFDLYMEFLDRSDSLNKQLRSFNTASNEINLATFQSYLKKSKTSLVEYHCTDDQILAIYLDSNQIKIHQIADYEGVKTRIKRYLKLINDKANTQRYKQLSEYKNISFQLYQNLLAPFIENNKDSSRLIIVPNGELSAMPFSSLLTERATANSTWQNLPYLLKKHPLSYALSSDLLYKKDDLVEALPIQNILAAFWTAINPKNKLPPVKHFDDLYASVEEADALKKNFSDPHRHTASLRNPSLHIYDGKICTKNNFLKNVFDKDIIHISSHGQADTNLLMNSFIVFHTPRGEADSLFSYELYDTKMKAKLVVLSACETGLGKDGKGEGMFSIARGFAVAGVPTIMQSLWQINANSTPKIMRYFYTNLSISSKPVKALTDAQLEYIQNSDNLNAHPYYWASFVMIVSRFEH